MCNEKAEGASQAIHNTVNMIAEIFGWNIYGWNPSERRKNLIRELEQLKRVAEQSGYRPVIRIVEGKETVDLLIKAAEEGDAEAMYCLGRIYQNGECGVQANHNEAKKWYLKAVEKEHAGSLEAMYQFGKFYEDEDKEIYWNGMECYKAAADNGHAQAMYRLGKIYENGELGIVRSFCELERWYRKAAENEHAEAMYEIACIYEEISGRSLDYFAEYYPDFFKYMETDSFSQDFKSLSKDWFKKAAKSGHVEAMFRLGWFEEAAERGHVGAMYVLGKEDISWLEKAADMGHFNAMYEIALSAYDEGNYEEAVSLLRKVAEEESEGTGEESGVARNKLGKIFYDKKNFSTALYWFKKAGDGYAGRYIGLMYYHGDGVVKDYAEAKIWFEEALFGCHADVYDADLGVTEHIMYLLGKICEAERDQEKAQEWYLKAAIYGHAEAQKWLAQWLPNADRNSVMYRLGEIYEEEHYYERAYEWYHRAAVNGHTEAKNQQDALKLIKGKKIWREQSEKYAEAEEFLKELFQSPKNRLF